MLCFYSPPCFTPVLLPAEAAPARRWGRVWTVLLVAVWLSAMSGLCLAAEQTDKATQAAPSPSAEQTDKATQAAPSPSAEQPLVQPLPVKPSLTGQPAASTPNTDEDVWNSLFQSRLQGLNKIMEQVHTQVASLPRLLLKLKNDTAEITTEQQRLHTLAQISRNLPMELGVVLEQMQRLQDRLNLAAQPLVRILDATDAHLGEMSQLELKVDESALRSAASLAANQYFTRLGQSEKELAALKSRLNYALAPVSTLTQAIQQEQTSISSSLPKLWKAYYLSPSEKLFDVNRWFEALGAVNTFREAFTLRMTAQFPQTLRELIHVLLRGVTVLAFLAGLTLLVQRVLLSAHPMVRNGLSRIAGHSMPWLYVGVSIYVAAWAPQGDPYHVLMVLATFVLSIGQMALAWDVRTFAHPDLPPRSPLSIFFLPLFGGLLLLFFNLPPVPLGALWVCILLFCIWSELRTPPPVLPFQLEGNLLRAHQVVLWVLLAVTLFGWGRLSILLCMAFAASAISLQQAVAFVKLSNTISGLLPQGGVRGLFGGVALALAVPVLLVTITLGTGLWALAYPGGAYLLDQVARLDIRLGERSLNLAQMLLIISAFYITRTVISVGRLFLRKLPEQGVRLDPALVSPLQAAYAYVLWALFGLYALSSMGFSLTSLAVVAGGLSVGVGFGMQSIINNFVSGLLMIFGQNLREGDIIEVGTVTGIVKRINIRSTMVETFDSAVIFVPNGSLLSNNLTNWTRNGRTVRRTISIGVAYGSDVRLVLTVLRELAEQHPQVLSYPEPMVLFEAFGSSTLNFELRVWMPDILQATSVLSELRIQINEAFAARQIEIAFPQLDIHVRHNGGLTAADLPVPGALAPAAPASSGSVPPAPAQTA